MSRMAVEVSEVNEQALSHFISNSPWDDGGLRDEIAKDTASLLSPDGTGAAVVIDESGYKKQGTESVGVNRQYCGSLGKVENCQVWVFLAYCSSDLECGVIDERLFLPESWCDNEEKCNKAGIPLEQREFKKKSELGLEMFLSAKKPSIPFDFVCMDTLYGRDSKLLTSLDEAEIKYVADSPCDTEVYLEYPALGVPAKKGNRGRNPGQVKVLTGESIEVRELLNKEELEWERIKVRDIERGELWIDFAAIRVWRKENKLPVKDPVWLLIRKDDGGSFVKYSLCSGSETMSKQELSEWQSRRYFVERALQDAKSLAGMADYQVRSWKAWHHHMTMVMLAVLFLHDQKKALEEKAPLLTLQDALRILEQVMPKKSLTNEQAINIIHKHHQKRYSARQSRCKKSRKKNRK